MTARLGVDIGGTFTDLVIVDERSGRLRVGKVLTTPKDPAHAVEQGIQTLLAEARVGPRAVRAVAHGTTLATNALIERKGARTALLTTAGFRDAIEIGREGRYDMYDLFIDPPAPLVPRHLRREVDERIGADGAVLRSLDDVGARAVVRDLVAGGVEAIAICTRTSIPPTSVGSRRSLPSSRPASPCPARTTSCPRFASTSGRRRRRPTSTSCR
jgi:N-methylhydantoinase A